MVNKKRILTSRDRRLLFHEVVTHSFQVRAVDVDTRLKEVLILGWVNVEEPGKVEKFIQVYAVSPSVIHPALFQ